MSDVEIMRRHLDAILPDGPIWDMVPGGDFDGLMAAMGDNWQSIMNDIDLIGSSRIPSSTPFFSDLEQEYGITPDPTISDDQRRKWLEFKSFSERGFGSASDMQTALDEAGFGSGGYGLRVFENSGNNPADPADFIAGAIAEIYCGGSESYCGFGGTSVCGYNAGGELVVNGSQLISNIVFVCCGNDQAYCGFGGIAVCGGSPLLNVFEIVYRPPISRPAWKFVFFIASSASVDSEGNITALSFGTVPANRMGVLRKLVLSVKPMSSWGVIYVTN